MFKILDKRNGEVTAEQQAVFNKISTNNADGYVDGFLNSLRIAKMSSNVISIDSGLLSIQGFRSVNDTLTTYTVSVTPSEPIPFQLVATYSHYISDENDTLEITTRPTQELRREPLFTGQNAVYEVELAEFNMTADGITDFTVTLEKIVYNEQDLSELLDKVTQAEQDSATALEKVNELETQVIKKQGTAVYVGGEAQSRVNFTSDPQGQITANKSDINDIVSGAQTAKKAEQDSNGNVIDTTYAKLSQVVRTDAAQTLNDGQKQIARNNVTTFISKGLPSAGWYRIAELVTSGFFEFQFNSVYFGTPPSPCKVFVSWGAQNLDKYSLTSISSNSASPIVQSVRLILIENRWYVDFYYNGTDSRDIVGIVMSGVSYNDAFAQIIPIDFTPVDNTGTVLTSLDITAGINTTGGVYQNGSPVFATDPAKLAPSTANGWTQTTATGSLPSSGIYMIAFDYLPSGSQPTYYNPAILIYDGTVGSCTVTDDTGVLLVSMVVKPSGIRLVNPVNIANQVQSTNIYYKRIA